MEEMNNVNVTVNNAAQEEVSKHESLFTKDCIDYTRAIVDIKLKRLSLAIKRYNEETTDDDYKLRLLKDVIDYLDEARSELMDLDEMGVFDFIYYEWLEDL